MVLYILHALILCLHARDWLSCLKHTISPLLVAAHKPPAAVPQPPRQGKAPPPQGHATQALQLYLDSPGPQQQEG
jgi:hypothetical protein